MNKINFLQRDLQPKDFGLDNYINMLSAPICECGCGGKLQVQLPSEEDIFGFIGSMLSEPDNCMHRGIFILTNDKFIRFGFTYEDDEEDMGYGIEMYTAQDEGDSAITDLSCLAESLELHCIGLLVEQDKGSFKIIEG